MALLDLPLAGMMAQIPMEREAEWQAVCGAMVKRWPLILLAGAPQGSHVLFHRWAGLIQWERVVLLDLGEQIFHQGVLGGKGFLLGLEIFHTSLSESLDRSWAGWPRSTDSDTIWYLARDVLMYTKI